MTVDPNEIEAPESEESGEESQEHGQNEAGEESQDAQSTPHSHVLTLANGKTHLWDAADGEPNGPVPTEIDGVPVVHVAHAGEAL
jgi:hypothetical protein